MSLVKGIVFTDYCGGFHGLDILIVI